MARRTPWLVWIVCALACAQAGVPTGAGGGSPPATVQTVEIEAARDNTLFESTQGHLSNGAGDKLFVGRTHQGVGSVRRALIVFDLANAVPAKSEILDATLALHVELGVEDEFQVALHRVLAAWGEGASSFRGGRGAPAAKGDATWIHTFHAAGFWARPGGEYSEPASAVRAVGGKGVYTWGPAPEMRDDVQRWLDRRKRNFGWVLVGDETQPGTVKAFSSRESDDPVARPRLSVTYRSR